MFKGLKNMGAMASLMKDLPAMQARMEEVRASLGEIRVTGEAGAGAVRVTIGGDMVVHDVSIQAAGAQGQDLEALMTMAMNDGLTRAQRAARDRIAQAAADLGIPLPPGGELPALGL
jgi:DNA-binding protein YbaB